MEKFLNEFAKAMVALNGQVEGHSNNNNLYKPGIGPYGEDEIVDMVISMIKSSPTGRYGEFFTRPSIGLRSNLGLNGYLGLPNSAGKEKQATPDLVFDNKIIEFKIARPLRDNGEREDTWFKKVFEPNPDSYSTFLDVEKLCRFRDRFDKNHQFEKWVVVIGFERINEIEYRLDDLFPDLFSFISDRIRKRPIRNFLQCSALLGDRHPFHQVVKLYAFEY